MTKLFASYDVVATPGRATVSYRPTASSRGLPGISGGPPVIPAGNLTGLPALAMPNGFGENGLPTSIAFLGPAFAERRLAEIGTLYQQRSDWHLKRPAACEARRDPTDPSTKRSP